MTILGKHAVVQQLRHEGVSIIFGNPGSTELALLDAVAASPIVYMLGLHEAVCMAMATGYAKATRRPAVVNLHCAAGLGNAMGMMFNACREQVPLVILVGQQDTRHLFTDPLISGDLVQLAQPFVKWVTEVQHADQIPFALRRAFKTALEAPFGPVVVSLPQDLLDQPVHVPIIPTAYTAPPSPSARALDTAADLLSRATSPLFLCGDGLAACDGHGPAVRLAELLGATVVANTRSMWSFPNHHPQFRGGPILGNLRGALANHDCVLAIGAGQLFRPLPYEGLSPFPDGSTLIQIDLDPSLISKNYPAAVGIHGDPGEAAERLVALVEDRLTDAQRAAARGRAAALAQGKAAQRERALTDMKARWDAHPISPSRVAGELERYLTPTSVLVGATGTAVRDAFDKLLSFSAPMSFFGGSEALGFPIPGALGIKLAMPDRQVVCILREGDGMYTIQGLWTAKRYGIDVKYIVLNDLEYRALKKRMVQYWRDSGTSGELIAMDLDDPPLDYAKLAAAFEIPSRLVEHPDDLPAGLDELFSTPGVACLDVRIARFQPSEAG
jgi:benzoylformate decarboxylase